MQDKKAPLGAFLRDMLDKSSVICRAVARRDIKGANGVCSLCDMPSLRFGREEFFCNAFLLRSGAARRSIGSRKGIFR